MEIKRRSILKGLLTLPVVSAFGKLSFGSTFSADAESNFQSRYLAVRTLRLLNTAQAWHRDEHGEFVNLGELRSSSAMAKLMNHSGAERSGIGKSLISIMKFGSTEIVPGWLVKFFVEPSGKAYSIRLSPKPESSVEELPSFATDHEGMIYEGDGLVPIDDGSIAVASTALTNGVTIDQARGIVAKASRGASAIRSMLASLAFFECVGDNGCCCMYPCGCDPCQCNQGYVPNLCTNCGCRCCVWCCCLY